MKKSLSVWLLLTNLVLLAQPLLAQGSMGGSPSPTAVPASSEGFGATIFWVGAAIFASQLPVLRQLIRPIYAQIGIIPEVAAGIHSASVLQEPPED
jgi:hypothetical protein